MVFFVLAACALQAPDLASQQALQAGKAEGCKIHAVQPLTRVTVIVLRHELHVFF